MSTLSCLTYYSKYLGGLGIQYSTKVNLKNNGVQTVTIPNCFKMFAIFKNVEHSFEPGETPSDSASHQALNYVQRPLISQNNTK